MPIAAAGCSVQFTYFDQIICMIICMTIYFGRDVLMAKADLNICFAFITFLLFLRLTSPFPVLLRLLMLTFVVFVPIMFALATHSPFCADRKRIPAIAFTHLRFVFSVRLLR